MLVFMRKNQFSLGPFVGPVVFWISYFSLLIGQFPIAHAVGVQRLCQKVSGRSDR